MQLVLKLSLILLCSLPLTLSASSQTNWHEHWFVLGSDFGTVEKKSVSSPEVENEGVTYSLQGYLSKYQTKWVGDLGLGFRFDNMEKSGIKVNTKSFQAGLGYRYRVTDEFSIGPQIHLLMGQDVSFSDTGTNSDDKKVSGFGGIRGMYDWKSLDENNQQSMWRFGFGYMTDLSISERQINYLHLSLEYAWPIRKAKKMIGIQKESFISFDMKAANMRFISGSADLESEAKQKLKKLSELLLKYNHEWDYVDIDGHTDITGDYKNNVRLSWARAEAVKAVMSDAGINPRKLHTTGYGPDRPLSKDPSPEALAKNRRVEIGIIGDSASKTFINELNKLLELKK
jgi:outer membrane protein OmpA-like peptidoglycan-associated protein